MAVKATCLVGLDVHARQTHAAVLDLRSGELSVRRLVGAPEEVVAFLERLPGPIVAVYEAGPTGFGLARRLSHKADAPEIFCDPVPTLLGRGVPLARTLAIWYGI